MIVIGRLFEKLHTEKDAVMQCHKQDINITTNLKVKVDFTLPALSRTNVLMWKYHVDESDKGRYNMISGKVILTELGLNLKLSEHVTEADDGPFKGSTAAIVDLGTYILKK